MTYKHAFLVAGTLTAIAIITPGFAMSAGYSPNPAALVSSAPTQNLLHDVRHTQKHIDEVREARERRRAERERRRQQRQERRQQRRLRGGGSF